MALELSAPTVSAAPLERRVGRATIDRGPNLFLDNGWLAKSYETGETYELPVDGRLEAGIIKKGPKKGEPTERLTGDAAEVTRQLREAAEQLNIGVSIKYYPIKNERTKKVIEGKLLVKYVGITRKQRRQPVEAETPAVTE